MPEKSNFTIRLSKAAREFNIGKAVIVEFLAMKGFQVDSTPNTKLSAEMYVLLAKEFQGEKAVKEMAKELGDLSYKGGSVSIESNTNIETGTAINRGKESLFIIPKKKRKKEKSVSKNTAKENGKKEISKEEKEKTQKKPSQSLNLEVPFSTLEFGQGIAYITYKESRYIYKDHNIKDFDKILEQIYSKVYNTTENSIKTFLIRVEIDLITESFTFKDIDICKYVNKLRDSFLHKSKKINSTNEALSTNEEKKETTNKSKVEMKIPFSEFKFGPGFVYFNRKRKKRYFYRDLNIRDYDTIIGKLYSRLPKAKKKAIESFVFKVIIDVATNSFIFKDIDICTYINHLMGSFLPEYKKAEPHNEIPLKGKVEPQKSSSALKSMMLEAGNIRFFNGYYLIFHTNNGEIDNSVIPCRVNDLDSTETLNLVHKYFEKKLEQSRIFIKYDETKVLEPSRLDLFQLSNYIKILKRNLDIKGEWWEEVQNGQKPSLAKCRSISSQIVKRKVSLKNGYLDNLSSMQSEKKLISVYEVNHGKEEDAFIFTINMPNNRCAIVFENASNDASTTTWVFVAKNENYELCINLVFDYFTDYTLSSKRSTLRIKTVNPPDKFKAENYTFIDHDDLGQWLKKLNKILEQSSEPSDIAFVPGLHIPESSETRTGHSDTITTNHLHNQLMRKLYDKLCSESGKDNVGTEIRVGTKRIDCVVKGNDCYDIYEIKTADNPFDCVTEALGQLCQYAYLFCRDKIGKMVIVGAAETTKEVEQYLSTLRKNHSLELYYIKA